jgi:amino-acid N-acetyltransferase
VGLELHGDVALLRSLVVEPAHRGSGDGVALVAAAEEHARHHGVRQIYLLTTTAAPFFARLGWRDADRDGAPDAIRRTREFSGLCPSTASFMVKAVTSP